jgi:protoheme IX farnesyltransferase
MNAGAQPLPLTPATSRTASRRRAADFLMLTKPRLVSLVLVTTVVGFYLGSAGGDRMDLILLLTTIVGTALAAAGAQALNQYIERDLDARMARTRLRPLPDGRLQPVEALAFGVLAAGSGPILLTFLVNPLAGAVTAATVGVYLFVYTPLKRRTSLATIAGAVPGALPPVVGWVAARGEFGGGAVALFTILFLWQLPHFLSLAWLHREDYARAGIVVLPSSDPDGAITARQMLTNLLALLPAALLPSVVGIAGPVYFVGSLVLGLAFLGCGIAFAISRSRVGARRVFLASLAYLPALLALLTLGRTAA